MKIKKSKNKLDQNFSKKKICRLFNLYIISYMIYIESTIDSNRTKLI